MYIFINDIDRTGNVLLNSISIDDQLQERINQASMDITWFSPSSFDDLIIYEGFPVISSTSSSITIKKDYYVALQNNIFRVWDEIFVNVNTSTEEKQIIVSLSENGWFLKIITWTFTNTPTAWSIMWKKVFAWNIIDIQDKNNSLLKNIEYSITALDYTRVFDKENINDTYANKDSRYIVNDFCNSTINKNTLIDQFDYANTTALRTIWSNSPSLDSGDYMEGSGSLSYSYVPVWSTETVATITPTDISDLTWWLEITNIVDEVWNYIVDEIWDLISSYDSVMPTKWVFGFWYKWTNISSITVKIGTDSSNHMSFTITPTLWEWIFYDKKFTEMTRTWSPSFAWITYISIWIVSTGSALIKIDWIRILEEKFFRHYPYVETSISIENFKISRVKPIEVMQRLAESLAWYWYVDYNRYIHLFNEETNDAPIEITETSNNFRNLSVSYDTSRLINRQVIRWWEETSNSTYSQIVEGDGVVREWILKNKFKNLIVKLNDWSLTDTAEVWTTTTTIYATWHGLIAWDYIVNRTRSNAVREVLTASIDSFTVESVTWQTNGDSFSLFVAKTVAVEWINDDAGNNYMSNFNEKSIRSSSTEPTLYQGEFLLFIYNEVVPILVQRTDNVSVDAMIARLWYSNGIFDWQPITDQTLTTRSEAQKLAEATLRKYSNIIITATFQTNQEGLKSGQLIRIKDTLSSTRNIDQYFIIQNVKLRQVSWGENIYSVTCSSLLFWMLELFQQLLAMNRKIRVSEDEIVANIEDAYDTITISDSTISTVWWEITNETITISDSTSSSVILPPFKYWPTGTKPAIYWLSSYG